MTLFGLLERIVLAYERDVDARVRQANMYLEQASYRKAAEEASSSLNPVHQSKKK